MDLTEEARGIKSLRRPLTALVLFVGLCLALTPALAEARVMPRTSPKQKIAGRYIVVLRDSVADPEAAADRMSKRHRFHLRQVYRRALKGFAARIPESILPILKRNSNIAFIEPDRVVYALDQTLPSGVDRIQADQNDTAQDSPVDVDIAIIDTGIDLDHPDLNVVASVNCARWFGGCAGNGICRIVGFQWIWAGSISVSVVDVYHPDLTYDPAANDDPDGDSDGTRIVNQGP